MTILHACFSLRNFRAFQQLLDDKGQSATPSTSGGKSSGKPRPLATVNVNARDAHGRSVLHLACSALEDIDYVRCLLRHAAIDVNILDEESHWTPLHRALYHGNLPAALLLLQRSDIDTSLKDYEGYTAADLYNSTIERTSPSLELDAELYTWGTNRNATLGLGDGDDRTFPEAVAFPVNNNGTDRSLKARFCPVHIRQVQMSRLHSVVVTSEALNNLYVCGFGSGGRLGPVQHTQYKFKPIAIPARVIAVAPGQDHTLALTTTGEIFSWGLNRFSQLGYVVEPAVGMSRLEEPIQVNPRRIHGPLKKEIIRGVAASKMRSAAYTSTGDVFSWGTYGGQAQVLPRKVTKVTKPVISISLTDLAMACLLETQEVICIWNDRSVKINFPSHGFPSEIQPYRPPQAIRGTQITKIVSSDELFAALSSNGELFTFSVPNNVDTDPVLSKSFRPQRVWALRKQFSAITDVAIGAEGSIIICTKSGHVFYRNTAGKAFKFQRVPFIQRAVNVAANQTGGCAALRLDHTVSPIAVGGNQLPQDLATIRPYMMRPASSEDHRVVIEPIASIPEASDQIFGDDADDLPVLHDHRRLLQLLAVLKHWKDWSKATRSANPRQTRHFYGADIEVQLGNMHRFPAHRVILAARSPTLGKLLCSRQHGMDDRDSSITIRNTGGNLQFNGCQAITILLLLEFIYTDQVLTIWDGPLSRTPELLSLNIIPTKVKNELQDVARLLGLTSLVQLLSSLGRHNPTPTIVRDISDLHHRAQVNPFEIHPAPDVILRFAGKEIYTYSVILRCRTEFFASFFGEPDWTKQRWNNNKMLPVDLQHLKWTPMEYAVRFMCCGEDREMFESLDSVHSVDDILDLAFEVMAVANELLLDRLVDLCAETILQFVNTRNICSIFSDAVHFHALSLIESTQDYMAVNMETLLEGQMLEHLAESDIKRLSRFVQAKQRAKWPATRTTLLLDRAMAAFGDWLSLQDIPEPIIPSNRTTPIRRDSSRVENVLKMSRRQVAQDDIFTMDDVDPDGGIPQTLSPPTSVWKLPNTRRVDMRTLMAEAANAADDPESGGKRQNDSSEGLISSTPFRPSTSPWKQPAQSPLKDINFPKLGQSSQSRQSHLGPVFTPVRPSNPSPSSIRRVSSGNAWITPTSPSPPQTAGVSFAAIQQQQREQATPVVKEKQSLLEIQKQEEDRRTEEEFLKWWAAEEERLKEAASSAARRESPKKKPKRTKSEAWPRHAQNPDIS